MRDYRALRETQHELSPGSTGESAELQTQLLSMDGGMVNIEREGWKELKVGLVGTVIAEEPAAADELSLVRTTAAHYCAVLGDLSTFTPSLNERTLTRLPARASPLMGTAWIWNLADAHFFDSLQIFDWYPARQHLSLAAQAIGLTARIT